MAPCAQRSSPPNAAASASLSYFGIIVLSSERFVSIHSASFPIHSSSFAALMASAANVFTAHPCLFTARPSPP